MRPKIVACRVLQYSYMSDLNAGLENLISEGFQPMEPPRQTSSTAWYVTMVKYEEETEL